MARARLVVDMTSLGYMLAGDLRSYLQESREGVVNSLEGLAEYDVRRPLVSSGTNLLGLVKHLVGMEMGYLGECVGRRSPIALPWIDDGSVWQSADMWATPDQSRGYLLDLYRRAWQHSDESLAAIPLDAPASVPWWSEQRRSTTFGRLVACVLAETAQHAGHCDIVRELIDGRTGAVPVDPNLLARIQSAADVFRPAAAAP